MTAARAQSRAVAEPGVPSIEALRARYGDADAATLLAGILVDALPRRVALVSSFGAEAAVLLHMVAGIDPGTPVIFLNTGKLFVETLRYRDLLVNRLGLTDVRSVAPSPERVERMDGDGVLWYGNPDMCCLIRKVEPMRQALAGFAGWITGRKGFHGGERAGLPAIESTDDGRLRFNPLAAWQKADVDAYFQAHDLPRHPLEARGYASIGCVPCTDRVHAGEDPRAGRWRGREKTECGIHLDAAKWKIIGID